MPARLWGEPAEIKLQLSLLRMQLRKLHISSVKAVYQNQKPEATHFHFDSGEREALIGSRTSLRLVRYATAFSASKFVSNATKASTSTRGIFTSAALTFHHNRVFFQVAETLPHSAFGWPFEPLRYKCTFFPSHFKCHLAHAQTLFISSPRHATW